MTNGNQGRLSINVFRVALCLLLITAATSLMRLRAACASVDAAAAPTRRQEKVTAGTRRSETRTTIRRSDGDYSMEATVVGDLEFADDEADVKSLSKDGRLLIKERHNGNVRTLEIVRGADGQTRRSYFVQGQARTFDQEARAWLARIMPELIRSTGLNAANRVQRILGQRGVDGVLEEIALIESDGVQRIYFDELLWSSHLNDETLGRIVLQSAREISSDGEKANLFIAHASRLVGDTTFIPAFFEAVNTINSDGERARVLSTLLERNKLPRGTLLRLFNSAARISSDGEKANLLVMAVRHTGDDQTVLSALYDAVRTISSDAERGRVISALAQRRASLPGRL